MAYLKSRFSSYDLLYSQVIQTVTAPVKLFLQMNPMLFLRESDAVSAYKRGFVKFPHHVDNCVLQISQFRFHFSNL